MSGAEVIAVVACVAAVVSAYHDGHQLFSAMKRKWKQHRHPTPPTSDVTTSDLELSLRRGQEDIVAEWNHLAGRLGRRFEEGDQMAREQMKDIVIELQRALLTNFRQNNAQLDLLALLQASDRGRQATIRVFNSLYHRLLQASSIPLSIDIAPALFDPTATLGYWIKLIKDPYLPQLSPPGYTSGISHSPHSPVWPGGLSGSPPDIMTIVRQMEDRASPPPPTSPAHSRRASKTSLGSILTGRRRSSGEPSSPRGDFRSRVGSGAGLSPTLEMQDHYMSHDLLRGGRTGTTGAYSAPVQERLEQDLITAARLQRALHLPQGPPETDSNSGRDQPPVRRQSPVPESARHKMKYESPELTNNPWMESAPESPEMHRRRTSSPELFPEPETDEHESPDDLSRRFVTDTPWAQHMRPLPIRGPPSSCSWMADADLQSSRSIPRLQLDDILLQDRSIPMHSYPPFPTHGQSSSQPGFPQPTDSISPYTGTSPPMHTLISHSPSPHPPPSITSTISTPSSTSTSNPPSRTFWPPSNDNNYAGFCKGAWKLHSGLGGFKVFSEPIGFYAMETKWRCAHCYFEMPLAPGSDRHDPKHLMKIFTHASTGIQFRWLFLAKSHMKCKRVDAVGGVPKQTRGPFGCIFCCRERGVQAPPFEGLDEFMAHLSVEHWSCVEGTLLERASCVVGRVAGVEEVFDVNIPPPRAKKKMEG